MKKMLISLIVGTLITATSSVGVMAAPGGHHKPWTGHKKPAYGQKQKPPYYGHKEWEVKSDAEYILDRTVRVMRMAQQMAGRGHHYSGLGLAYAHQQRAQELYANGLYRDAIYFSLRARDLAFEIIDRNYEKPYYEFRRDDREECYHDGPSGEELDSRLDRHKLDRDQDVIHLKIEFHL